MRDYRQLRTFRLSDQLVLDVYRVTRAFPAQERYGLQAQLRRAAVSAPSNIVEGSARRTQAEYVQFLHVALGSAVESGYLAGLSLRLEFIGRADGTKLVDGYDQLAKGLQRQIDALTRR